MPVGPATAIGQSLQPTVLVASEELIASLTGDIDLPPQHRHLLPIQQPGHKTKALVHLATLPPRHLRVPRKCRKVLPMCPEWSVTYVPESTLGAFRSHRLSYEPESSLGFHAITKCPRNRTSCPQFQQLSIGNRVVNLTHLS